MLFPNSLVDSINENNKIKTNLKNKIIDYERELARSTDLANTIAIIINVLTGLIILAVIVKIVKVYKVYDKEYKSNFEGEYLRELPYDYTPAEMSYLYYFGHTQDEDVTATLLDLVRRKYLKLDTKAESLLDSKPDYDIYLNKNVSLNGLKPHEIHLINWFICTIGNGEKVSLPEIEKYGKKYKNATNFEAQGKKFKELINQTGKEHNWFENAAQRARSKEGSFAFLPILFAIFCFLIAPLFGVSAKVNGIIGIILAIIYFFYICSITRRTVSGNEEFTRWQAFKRFLEDFGNMKDYPMPGIIVWEHYLVYATSLKIADKVMDQLKVKLPETDFESEDATYMRTTRINNRMYYGYMFNSINHTVSTARQNVVSTIASHNASSGSSGGRGGGFSGGSSFGGGGGGGRSR